MSEDSRAHERLDRVEAAMKEYREEHKRFEASIQENTELTRSIEENTKELVAIFKGASSVRIFFVWASPIAAAIAGTVALINWLIGRGH